MKFTLVLVVVFALVATTCAVKMPQRFSGPVNPTAIGSRDMPVDHKEIQEAAKAAVDLMNKKENENKWKLVEVVSSSTLFRAGHEYNLILKLSDKSETKSTHKVVVRVPLDSTDFELVMSHHLRAQPTH